MWIIVYLKWRIESNCSWKRVFCFNKRPALFDKRALRLSRSVGGGRISPNWKMFLTSNQSIQINKKFFFQKKKSIYPRMLNLSKIGPANCEIRSVAFFFLFVDGTWGFIFYFIYHVISKDKRPHILKYFLQYFAAIFYLS